MAVTTNFFDNFLTKVGTGVIDLQNHNFKIALFSSAYIFDSTKNLYSELTGEIGQQNGYNVGGQSLNNLTFVKTSTGTKWGANNVTFTPVGGTLNSIKGAIIYDSTSGNNLCCYIDFGEIKTINVGDNLILYFGNNGIIKFAI